LSLFLYTLFAYSLFSFAFPHAGGDDPCQTHQCHQTRW
jgi:hypothetical protein